LARSGRPASRRCEDCRHHDGQTSGERLQHPDVGVDPRGEILGVLQARSGLSVMCSVGCPRMIRSVEVNASGTLGSLVAGAGFEPATFGLCGRSRARRLPSAPNRFLGGRAVTRGLVGLGWGWSACIHGQFADTDWSFPSRLTSDPGCVSLDSQCESRRIVGRGARGEEAHRRAPPGVPLTLAYRMPAEVWFGRW
jgi:hypothetical protein